MTDAPIECSVLHGMIEAETDPVKKAALQADFDQRCGGGATDSGGGGTGTNPPAPPKQPN